MPSIDIVLAKRLAQACDFVYHFDPARGKFTNDPPTIGNPDLDPPLIGGENQTAVAGVMRYSVMTVLVFRGTIANVADDGFLPDWRENFEPTLITPDEGQGRVHQGFYAQLNFLKKQILAALGPPPGPPLYITGHSQGAAMAALATPWLTAQRFNVAATYTFAAPRPGDQAFADSVTTPVFRVEFGDDIVPHVPLSNESTELLAALARNPLFQLPQLRPMLDAVAGDYAAVGQLTYRRLLADLPPYQDLQTDLSADVEIALAKQREDLLLRATLLLVENHLPAHYISMFDPNQWPGAIENATEEIVGTSEEILRSLAGKLPFKNPFSW
jgi:hypothetical protein